MTKNEILLLSFSLPLLIVVLSLFDVPNRHHRRHRLVIIINKKKKKRNKEEKERKEKDYYPIKD